MQRRRESSWKRARVGEREEKNTKKTQDREVKVEVETSGEGGWLSSFHEEGKEGWGGGPVSQSVRPGDEPGAGFTLSGPGTATSPWGNEEGDNWLFKNGGKKCEGKREGGEGYI